MVQQRRLGKKMVGWIGGLLYLLSPMTATANNAQLINSTMNVVPVPMGWKEFHSKAGNCSMMFPNEPEHISEKMAMPDEGFELAYDAYISAAEQKAVYMLLVAKYPDFVDESYAQMSLEGFLNGILTHNPGNQLLFADLLLVDGNQALDFFIRTGNVYFKGRAVMVKNSMYLMAMECEIPHYDEIHYKHFVESFKIHALKTAAK
jgi:hypothetical protein